MSDDAQHAADAVTAAIAPYAEEIAERCEEAQTSAGDMRGACDDASRAVAGLAQLMEQSRAGIGASRQASDEATSARLERISRSAARSAPRPTGWRSSRSRWTG